MWPFTLPHHVQARLVRFVLEKTMSRFLLLQDMDLESIDVCLTQGSLALCNVRLNVNSLNKYLDASAVRIKEGTIQSVTVSIGGLLDGGGGEVIVEGMELTLASAAEEMLVFYDALESSVSDLATMADLLVHDLSLAEFQDSQRLDGGAVDLVHHSLSRMLGSFVLSLRDTRIVLLGPQTYLHLVLAVPSLEAYQLTGEHTYSVEIPEGFELRLLERTVEQTLLRAEAGISLQWNLLTAKPTLEIPLMSALLDASNLLILREFVQIYQRERQCETPSFHPQPLEACIRQLKISLGTTAARYEALIEDIVVSLDTLLSLSCSKINLCNQTSMLPVLALDAIQMSIPPGSARLVVVHRVRAENDILTLIKVLEELYQDVVVSSMTGKPSKARESMSLTIRVDWVDLPELQVELDAGEGRVAASVAGLELALEERQTVVHIQDGSWRVNSSAVQVHRLSMYRSLRNRPGGSEPPDMEWPFSPVTTLIEGATYIAVVSLPEDYFLLRSRTIEACQEHWHLSVENITLELSLKHTLAWLSMLAAEGRGPTPSAPCVCLTASINSFLISEADTALNMTGNAVELLVNWRGTGQWSLDLRGDPVEISLGQRKEEGRRTLAHKVLTTSLDPHYKPFIATILATSDAAMRGSVLMSGMTFSIPLFSSHLHSIIEGLQSLLSLRVREEEEEAEEGHDSPHPEASMYVQLQRCSFLARLPEKYHCEIAPHVLYLDALRLVTGTGGAAHQAFLQKGEVFMAPSRLVVRPVSGLFDEGHNYWEEQNYEAICKFDFVQIRFTRVEGKGEDEAEGKRRYMFVVEDHLMTLDLYQDSMQILVNIVQKYLHLMREQRLVNAGDCTKEGGTMGAGDEQLAISIEGLDLDEEEREGKGEERQHAEHGGLFLQHLYGEGEGEGEGEKILFDENFYAFTSGFGSMEEDSGLLEGEGEGEDEFKGLFEIPMMPRREEAAISLDEEEVKLRLFQEEGVQYEEDFFAIKIDDEQNYAFPFSVDADAAALMVFRLRDFSLRIRLLSGQQWHPNRSQQVVPLSAAKDSDSVLGGSVAGSLRARSHISSQPSSRWSCLVGSSRTPSSGMLATLDSVEIVLQGIDAECAWNDPFPASMANAPDSVLVGMRVSVGEVSIVDHVRASRWKSLLCRRHQRGGHGTKPMLRMSIKADFVERRGQESEPLPLPEDHLEYNVKMEVVPLRLHVDQDTLLHLVDFFHHPSLRWSAEAAGSSLNHHMAPLFIQTLQLSEVSLRIDYKPKRLDVKKMVGGRYFELMNLFDLEDAELFLPAVKLRGVSGVGEVGAELVRAWLPHVRNTQMGNMLSGITPVRTVMNLGGGMVDLIVLPIEQYRRKGRLVNGLKRGTFSFLQSTVLETARIGKKLAVGAQTVLEHADDIVEGGNGVDATRAMERGEERRLGIASTSKYSAPPADAAEGALAAYSGLRSTLHQAAHTVIAVPIQVYEQQGTGGAAKAVLRAVPVAALRTLIGASEALGKAMMGLESSLDETRGVEIKQKYKARMDRYPQDPLSVATANDDVSLGSSFPPKL